MKKENKTDNWILVITLILVINLFGYYIASGVSENNNLADKWREVVDFENGCPSHKVVLIQYNNIRHNLFCLTKEEIVDFLSKAEADSLLDWFRK